MWYDRILADAVVIFHLAFIVFAMGGAILVLRWPRLSLAHLPAAAWATLVEVMSWRCPLTRWEYFFRDRYGDGRYEGSFVDHYIIPIIYPDGLTPRIQLWIGLFVLIVNVSMYTLVIARWRKRRAAAREMSRAGFEVSSNAPRSAVGTATLS